MPRSSQELKYFIEQFGLLSPSSVPILDDVKAALDTDDEHAIHQAVLAAQARESLSPILYSGFQRYLENYHYEQNQAKPISFDKFPWESAKAKADEWDYAKQKLILEGVLLPDGTKLRRKDSENAEIIKHSFIIVDRKILAMAPQGEYLGKGLSAVAKLAEDENGGLWALKIRKSEDKHSNRTVPDSPEEEENISLDLGKSLKATRRASFFRHAPVEKHYLPFVYLGMPLNKYLEEHSSLTNDERYELAIKIALAVSEFHTGQDSKTQTRHYHGDINLSNFTIDDEGSVHLIDYGGSESIPRDLPEHTIEERYISHDIQQMLLVMQHIFTPKMRAENEKLLRLQFRQNTFEESLAILNWSRGDKVNPKPRFPWDSALEIAQELTRIQSNAPSASPKL